MTEFPAPDVAVIVVAAGSGSRLGHSEPKAFVPLAGRPMLEHALRSVFSMRTAAQVIVVAPESRLSEASAIARHVAGTAGVPLDIVAGGETRQDSVGRGLAVLGDSIRTVLVHDAARALTPPTLFDAVIDAVATTGHGIVPGLPVVDTIKRVDPQGTILGTVERSELSAMQTPQGFPRQMLVDATARANGEVTDDAASVAAAGHAVTVIPGHELAFKITTRWDLRRAELLIGTENAPRVGTGVDVHAFEPVASGDSSDDGASGAGLWLAGLYWPGERALSGHSDGDAVSHAICDALLAAAGLGDVGALFGTSDERFAGAHGEVFLRETLARVSSAGFRVSNVSVQVIGNRPKLAPRREEAQRLLSSILNAPVSVSATTSDALGFTGRGEGVAALASAIVVKIPATSPDLSWEA
ncbi:MAG: bifunctional 2-C-methyl-D-erythritol 4-phosphate cytidylyltransferase/2-C-methyl-D-erythritol [Cryobacterium sp.]|nr:bifunctional 2-C-methyl-D-erythritol 4-phosphate cytidylyltransferase/2-C-methyl-D-erythritol [Cryobacterium sp.]